MTDTPSSRRNRSRVAERAQHLYTARAEEYTAGLNPQTEEPQGYFAPNETDVPYAEYTPNEAETAYEAHAPSRWKEPYVGYTPNEEIPRYAGYTPNEEAPLYAAYEPNEEPVPAQADYAAYYSREGTAQQDDQENAFAPPPSMQHYAYEPQTWQEDPESQEADYTAATVYHPRQATWADDEAREEALAESEQGYQVQEEEQPVRKKRHTLRNLLIVVLILALLGGAAWFLREQISQLIGVTVFITAPTEEPSVAVATPEPVKAYDAAPRAAVAEPARDVIVSLSGALEMEDYIVTDQHVVTRNQRPDGSYDFYLFTAAEGRLLCYFEGLEALDMIPQENGRFYVKQAPWLIAPGGSALIRTADIEAAVNESVFLHPMYNGWAIVESMEDGHSNYVNASGQVLSSLWFCRLFPFTGEYTLAYVDTGSTADVDGRYLLYVVGADGSMTRWLAAGQTEDVVASVCGMAYLNDGSLYRLPDTAEPVCNSPEITAYLDCNAMVIRDPDTGKYGLFVRGEQHYAFEYDSIRPLESDIVWAEKKLQSGEGNMTIKAVTGATFPQPLSYSFVLQKGEQTEYVALSTQSSYPIRLDGEF